MPRYQLSPGVTFERKEEFEAFVDKLNNLTPAEIRSPRETDSGKPSFRLVHHSNSPDLRLEPYLGRVTGFGKPGDLWYSWDGEDSWAQWCSDSGLEFLGAHKYAITIPHTHNILRLSSADEILAFSREYGFKEGQYNVPWERVIQDFDGIEIFPYQWRLRLDRRVSWYCTWDCASGCLWNVEGVIAMKVEA